VSERAALVEHARRSIARGSKSFAAASRLFDRTTRERVWLLYAWCRACDDMTDDQDHGGTLGDQSSVANRVAMIHDLTAHAFSGKITGNPAFDGLGLLSREVPITQTMADDVIAGFDLDAQGWQPHCSADLLRYCYHVAGAVGVMMATVMGVPASDEDTLDRACDLGLAFQLANIARDVSEDHAAGRCYLPADWLAEAGIPSDDLTNPVYRQRLVTVVARLCDLAETYEASARTGAARLPFRCRWAVLSAAGIYGSIARKVRAGDGNALDRRVHTGRATKLGHVISAFTRCFIPPVVVQRPAMSRQELSQVSRSR
jgi:15-cis-phytoene synthase